MIRFGKWDEILAEPMYTDKEVFPATIATQHYARGDAPEELEAVTALFKERSARADIVPAKTCFCAQDALAKSCGDTSCC